MKKVAISACLLGKSCRYDATDNYDVALLSKLAGDKLIPFCPEDDVFGTPRPTMSLVDKNGQIEAVCNTSGEVLSAPIIAYAKAFFDKHTDIDFLIGKDRSPSCGVCSARLYDEEKQLISSSKSGLMVKEAQKRGILCFDAEVYKEQNEKK